MYHSGTRRAMLNTVLTMKRQPISTSVFQRLLLCSSTEKLPASQSLKGLGMLMFEMTWIIFLKLVPSLRLNSREVLTLTRVTVRVCIPRRRKKTIRVILALRPV